MVLLTHQNVLIHSAIDAYEASFQLVTIKNQWQAGDVIQQLRALAAFGEEQNSVPSAILRNSQPSVTSAPRTLTASPGLAHADTQTLKKQMTNKQKLPRTIMFLRHVIC